jgi:predicted nucleotidyltransferase
MQSIYGLINNDLEIIISVLQMEDKIDEAVIFGSRAQGNFKNGIDVDIALKGKGIDAAIISRISFKLNQETLLPYKFDIINYYTINNDALIEQINHTGITIYTKSLGKYPLPTHYK